MENSARGEIPGIAQKVVVVTGGAAGIGRVICELMGRLGARVGVIDITEEKGKETVSRIVDQGGEAHFSRGDVTCEADIRRCMEDIHTHFRAIDILVNNAGIAAFVSFEELTLDLWKRFLDVNLTGAFICSKAALPYLSARGQAVIIMVSSGSAITGSGGAAAYAASKGGLNSLVRALSRELAPKGIRVNGVAPRSIESELLTKVYSPEHLLQTARTIPVGRMGTAQDVANVVAFLASDLSSFISGETLLVDGGRTFGS
jgi:NAD(P)-dependent dehydrogenase (short-subunit alcohol dehydrogenase family)